MGDRNATGSAASMAVLAAVGAAAGLALLRWRNRDRDVRALERALLDEHLTLAQYNALLKRLLQLRGVTAQDLRAEQVRNAPQRHARARAHACARMRLLTAVALRPHSTADWCTSRAPSLPSVLCTVPASAS